jgi:hypothetical protein
MPSGMLASILQLELIIEVTLPSLSRPSRRGLVAWADEWSPRHRGRGPTFA